MLKINDITFAVEGRTLFEGASATIPEGHKVGVVGRNGTGKTTLFRLIRGELVLEGGSITLPARARIGGVRQEVPSSETSLLDTVLDADTERASLLAESENASDPSRIAEIQTRLADIDAWSGEARATQLLRGLGFTQAEIAMPCSAFSGGWRMRVALAGVLFSQPDVLLLDEPTNYLDLEGALWLENYLTRYPHTVIIISHDRGLLNRSVNAILHLEAKKLALYTGNYDTFARTKAAQMAVAEASNRKTEARRAHLQKFVDRFRAQATKAKQAQSRIKMIERLETIQTPQEAALRAFSFPEPEELSPPIVNLESASVGYGERVVLGHMTLRIDQDDRIALLGETEKENPPSPSYWRANLKRWADASPRPASCALDISRSIRSMSCTSTKPPSITSAACAPTRRPPGTAPGSPGSGCLPIRRKRWSASSVAGRKRGCRCCSPQSTRRIC